LLSADLLSWPEGAARRLAATSLHAIGCAAASNR
jgi:hypothetical protein